MCVCVGSGRGRGVWQGEGEGEGGMGHFIYLAILHYHMVLRPKGTSHNKSHDASPLGHTACASSVAMRRV